MIEAASEVMESTVLRDTLLTLNSIRALTEWNGQHKIFWAHAPDTVPHPYIVMTHYWGGDEKDTRYADSWWLIYGHTADMATAVKFSNAIAELKGVWPITTAFNEVCAYAPLKKINPYFYRYQVEDRSFFRAGAVFRIRLFLGSIE
jgi:hypothetical protein